MTNRVYGVASARMRKQTTAAAIVVQASIDVYERSLLTAVEMVTALVAVAAPDVWFGSG